MGNITVEKNPVQLLLLICCMFEIETRIQTYTLMEWVPHSKNSHTIILYFF